MDVKLSPKKLLQFLIFVAVSLALISLAVHFATYIMGFSFPLRLTQLFNTNAEGNVPTWFSSSLLLICSLLLFVIAYIKSNERDRFARRWGMLAMIFLFLSLDEASSIHERLVEPVRLALRVGTGGFLRYAWVIPYGAALLTLVPLYLGFFFALPEKTKRLFLIACCTYVSGALGMELVGGYIVAHLGRDNMATAMSTTSEELLEMMGAIIFIYALLSYMAPHAKAIARVTEDVLSAEHETNT